MTPPTFDKWLAPDDDGLELESSSYLFEVLFNPGDPYSPDYGDYMFKLDSGSWVDSTIIGLSDYDEDGSKEVKASITYENIEIGPHEIKFKCRSNGGEDINSRDFKRGDADGLSYSQEVNNVKDYNYQYHDYLPIEPKKPNAPKNLESYSSGSDYIEIGWDTVDTATGYDIYRDGTRIEEGYQDVTYSDIGLSPSTQYTYYVKAVNHAGESGKSNVIHPSTESEDSGNIESPDNLQVNDVTDTYVKLSWDDRDDWSDDKIFIYRKLSHKSSFNKIDEVSGDLNGYSDTSVSSFSQYNYQITHYDPDTNKESDSSNTVTATTDDSGGLDPMSTDTFLGPYEKMTYSFKNTDDYDGKLKKAEVDGFSIKTEDKVNHLDIKIVLKSLDSGEKRTVINRIGSTFESEHISLDPRPGSFFNDCDYKNWEMKIEVIHKNGAGFILTGEPNLEITKCMNPYDVDTDGDGYEDGKDLYPFKDALMKIHIDGAGAAESSDSPDVTSEGDFYIKIKVDNDEWDSDVWQHSKVPIKKNDDYIESTEFDSEHGITFVRNVPDDIEKVNLRIRLKDDNFLEGEGSPDDIMDLDDQSPDGETLNLEYDIADQSWSGEDSGSFDTGYEVHDGKGDGGDDGLTDENDGQIKYMIYTDGEISPKKQEELASTYSPVMYFHEDEEHFPRDIGEFLDDSDLRMESWDVPDPTIESAPLSKSDLATHTTDNYYLDWDGEEPDHEEYLIYSHVFTATDNKIVIQYWFFYLDNPGTEYITAHEGDWEMIQIICDQNENLEKAGYSWHYEMKKSGWNTGDLQKFATHPKVFVEKDGHASNFETSSWGSYGIHEDIADSYETSGTEKEYELTILSNQDWLNFKGIWGEDGGSPNGPVFRYSKHGAIPPEGMGYGDPLAHMWIEPIFWHEATHGRYL